MEPFSAEKALPKNINIARAGDIIKFNSKEDDFLVTEVRDMGKDRYEVGVIKLPILWSRQHNVHIYILKNNRIKKIKTPSCPKCGAPVKTKARVGEFAWMRECQNPDPHQNKVFQDIYGGSLKIKKFRGINYSKGKWKPVTPR